MKKRSTSIRRTYLQIMKDKFRGMTHSHKQEKQRRVSQIARGFLKPENGLVIEGVA